MFKFQVYQIPKILSLLMLLASPLIFSAGLKAQELTMKSFVDRNPVWVNQQFQYTLEIQGSRNLPDVEIPSMEAFRIIGGPSQSSSYQIVNGAVSSSVSYTVVLLPKSSGSFTIPGVAITHRGKTYRSNNVVVKVTDQPPAGNGNRSQRQTENAREKDQLFLKAEVSRRSVFVNEPLYVSFKLYFRVPVRNLSHVKAPETVGFWVEEFEMPQNIPQSTEVLDGVRYNVAEIKRLALFPTKVGELRISPMQLSVDVVERRRRRDPRSLFDSFFDDPFGKTVREVVSSLPVKINARPVPAANKPADFSGLVGDFSLSTQLDLSEVNANEAISYKVYIKGNGNLKSQQDLKINFPSSFEVYDPKLRDNVDLNGTRFSASRVLEYVIIPRSPGEYTLEPLTMSYYDPRARRYKTLKSDAYTIRVNEGKDPAGGLASRYVAKSDVQLLGRDIHFIKEQALELVPVGHLPFKTAWFWMAMLLPLVVLGGAYGYRNHVEKMTTNQEYARQKTAFKQAHKRLKGAESLLKEGKLEAFYGEAARGITGFIADKSNLEAAGLLRTDIEGVLQSREVPQVLRDALLNQLDEADFRRFAGSRNTPESARDFLKKATDNLTQLGKFFN